SLAACLCHMADWLLHSPCAATRRFEQSCQPKVHCRRVGLHSSTTPDIPVVRKRCHTEFEAGPPDEEKAGAWGSIEKVSRPTIQVFLAAKSKANGASVLVFPGGGYVGLSMASEGATVAQFFQD